VPDVSPLRNVKFCTSLDFATAKDFVNIFSTKYYFTNYLEITLAEAKFGTPCCVITIQCRRGSLFGHLLQRHCWCSGPGHCLGLPVYAHVSLYMGAFVFFFCSRLALHATC